MYFSEQPAEAGRALKNLLWWSQLEQRLRRCCRSMRAAASAGMQALLRTCSRHALVDEAGSGLGLPSCNGMQVDEGSSLAEVQALLDAPLQQNSQLVTGQLDNGLCYVILPNAVPPERFEAHLEIHAGAPRGWAPPSCDRP